MSQSYKDNRYFSDKLIHHAFPIVGKNCTRIAPDFRDMNECVDIEVVGTDVGFRLRKWKDRCFKNDFTIRSKVKSGQKTELDKIISGWCRYLFYAIENEKGDGFHCFSLIDLNVFRNRFHQKVKDNYGNTPWKERPNGDGSWFVVFPYIDFPKELVIDSQGIDFNLPSVQPVYPPPQESLPFDIT